MPLSRKLQGRGQNGSAGGWCVRQTKIDRRHGLTVAPWRGFHDHERRVDVGLELGRGHRRVGETPFDRGAAVAVTTHYELLKTLAVRDERFQNELLDHLASVDMHAIQTSGNCIRNVTADPYAGATAEEVDDPRVWAEVIRQFQTLDAPFPLVLSGGKRIIEVRSATAGSGTYEAKFDHLAELTGKLADQVLASNSVAA